MKLSASECGGSPVGDTNRPVPGLQPMREDEQTDQQNAEAEQDLQKDLGRTAKNDRRVFVAGGPADQANRGGEWEEIKRHTTPVEPEAVAFGVSVNGEGERCE